MSNSGFLDDAAGICSNDPDALKAAEEQGTPVFGNRSSIAGPPDPDPIDEMQFDERGRPILTDALRARLERLGYEVQIGTGIGLFGVRTE